MPPISAAQLTALEQAAHWYSCLHDEAATEADRLGWQTWLQAAPLNAWAWEQVERLQQRMLRVPGPLAERTLDLAGRERQTSRRGVLKGLALVIGGSTLGWGGYRQASQGPWLADYRSQVGERLPVTLEDGSQLLLNSDSAVDIVFDGQQRLVLLKQGEIMVTTAADPHQRPFSVQTRQGRVLALGTRFTVREQDTTTTVAVPDPTADEWPAVPVRSSGRTRPHHAGFRRRCLEPWLARRQRSASGGFRRRTGALPPRLAALRSRCGRLAHQRHF
jgi:transmembrane sensor